MKVLLSQCAYAVLFATLFVTCDGMHLDFRNFSHDTGKEQGKNEAKHIVQNLATQNFDPLRPLFQQFDITLGHMQDFPAAGAHNQFDGYITGLGTALFVYNEKESRLGKPAFSFNATQFKALVEERKKREGSEKTQKNREELVKLLTGKLVAMKLLTLN